VANRRQRGALVEDGPRPAETLEMTPFMTAAADGATDVARVHRRWCECQLEGRQGLDRHAVVFDLLGDLSTLPTAGGKATRITSGT